MTPPNDWYSIKGYQNNSRWNTKRTKSLDNLSLSKIVLKIDSHRVVAQVAKTENDRNRGLMFYKKLPENHGMLFVFETLKKYCFWMKNTQLPLSIAFLRDDGTITKISDMQPYSLTTKCADEPVRYALEVNKGWFKKNKVNVGTRVINEQYFI